MNPFVFICYILVVCALITNRPIPSSFCVHLNPLDLVELFQLVTVIAKFDRVRTAKRFVDIQALFVNEVQGDAGVFTSVLPVQTAVVEFPHKNT